MIARSEAKARTRQQLLSAAQEAVQKEGASALSLRGVARRAGVVPSAVYRHFESRDALLTQLILDAYTSLAETLEAAVGTRIAGDSWRRAAQALRAWALRHRHEFLLIYGTPVPGYRAPVETVAAAARVAAVFISRVPDTPQEHLNASLHAQLAGPARDFGVSPAQLGQALAETSQLVGALVLELGGHFVGTADPADHLWNQILEAQQQRQSGAEAPSEIT
ncbi:TetR/AcrR family transcriptional regulator [Nesterenkonia alkaliphila]|uniref:TetR family transcriptional regulator n=1 Tax=Nesterenkonia alkaliphila TaxID=1463631 RepID=A0A7K1UH28_9MICC|nr:TetR/AcrR family transcriptional regulator [Nesterenkonia alkaliphila]MVT25768.1 TetR family transcriptional regulator [Nesterenkonia alkaliphila]GFZ93133.1 TetR family transcriptional regulator [Nesterenkonia alkaliphila]